MLFALLALLNPISQFRFEGETGTPSGGSGTPAPATSTGTPASSATTVIPASSTGTPVVAASSTATATAADDLQDGNWKQMRERLAAAQQRSALLDNLEGVTDTDLPVAWKQYQAVRTEMSTLGKALGYTDAEVKEAFEADPVFALSQLRQAKADADAAARVTQKPGESQVDYEKRIQEEVAKQTKPFTDHINKQLSDAVVTRIGEEFTKSYDAVLPNTPPEVRGLVQDYVEEYFASPANQNLIVAMKARGDYKSVDEVTRVVAGRLQSVFTKWVAHETTRTGGRTFTGSPVSPGIQGKGTGPNGKVTLDDMINDPGLIDPKYSA